MAEKTVKKRNANIELLRLLSMIMVVFLHALGKGDLLPNLAKDGCVNGWIAWVLECLSISAVNIFMLISGYFLIKSEFKLRRLLELVFEVMFFALGSFAVCLIFNINTGNEMNVYNTLFSVFPIHMDLYWFITSYIVIYMLQPILKAGVEHMSQKQFGTMIIVLLVFESLFKTVLPVRLEEDEFGYNVLWFLIVFLIGAYFRYYGFKHLTTTKKGAAAYFGATILIFAETVALMFFTAKTGRLSEIEGISTEYNHLFVLLSAIGIFAAFINAKPMKESFAKVICALSPMSLGVYLVHENWSFRYNWQKWLGIKGILPVNTGAFLLKVIVAVLIVFVVGISVDFVRIRLFSLMGGFFGKSKDR